MTSYQWLIVTLALSRTVSEIRRLLGSNPYPRGRHSRSRSSKVIDLGLNGKPIGDFLLVINCNLGPISHRFLDMASYWFKIAKFSYPPLIYGTRLGWPLWNFWKSVTDPETRVLGAADGEDDPSLHLFCLIHPCDRQTDRQNCDG